MHAQLDEQVAKRPLRVQSLTIRLSGDVAVIERHDGSLRAEISPQLLAQSATFTSLFARYRLYDARATSRRLQDVACAASLSDTQAEIARRLIEALSACATKDEYMQLWRVISERARDLCEQMRGSRADAKKVAEIFRRTHLCFYYPEDIEQLQSLCAGSLQRLYDMAGPAGA